MEDLAVQILKPELVPICHRLMEEQLPGTDTTLGQSIRDRRLDGLMTESRSSAAAIEARFLQIINTLVVDQLVGRGLAETDAKAYSSWKKLTKAAKLIEEAERIVPTTTEQKHNIMMQELERRKEELEYKTVRALRMDFAHLGDTEDWVLLTGDPKNVVPQRAVARLSLGLEVLLRLAGAHQGRGAARMANEYTMHFATAAGIDKVHYGPKEDQYVTVRNARKRLDPRDRWVLARSIGYILAGPLLPVPFPPVPWEVIQAVSAGHITAGPVAGDLDEVIDEDTRRWQIGISAIMNRIVTIVPPA